MQIAAGIAVYGGNRQIFFRHDGQPCGCACVGIIFGKEDFVAAFGILLQELIRQSQTFFFRERDEFIQRLFIDGVDDPALFGKQNFRAVQPRSLRRRTKAKF